MKNRIILIFVLLISNIIIPQEMESPENIEENIKIYLDCWECDLSFFRQNLELVNFVRDPKLADIHILVTVQITASGSNEYGINFIGRNQYSDIQYKLKTISTAHESDILRWERLLKILEIGILPYLSYTNQITNININYKSENDLEKVVVNSIPWDYWVYRLGVSSRFQAEESQNEYSFSSSFNADRITDLLKFKSGVSYYIQNEEYLDENEFIQTRKIEAEFDTDLIYSINPRLSAGIFGRINKSSYLNLHLASNIGAAIEYNIFPWDKSDRKVLTLAYQLNSKYFEYDKLTIYNKLKETKMSESLELSLILRQPWGDIENTVEASHYFYDFSKNRLSLNTDMTINIISGFSFFTHLNAELIHDQLYLPSGGSTREELLLQQNQLETSYNIFWNIGIRYTFGSIYNNIVNQRL
ncbi:hypothetical protein ACFL0J_03505 [Candidatus Neomarinimicrobiota bacterium]